MELKINKITIPEVIEFNYDELKAEITEKAKTYTAIVYGEDEIKQAKADKANLNKFLKALSDERIRIKKQCLQPYEDFEKKVKEITDIVAEPISIIDAQIKGYEDKKKAEKLETIKALFNDLEKPEWVTFEAIFDDKFLNASVSMASIKTSLEEAIRHILADTEIIEKMPEYSFEAMEIYKKCLDINRAVTEAQKMVEIAKAKAEAEKAREEAKKEEPTIEQPEEIKAEDEPKWVKFQALMTVQQAKDLAWFFRTKGIDFKPV